MRSSKSRTRNKTGRNRTSTVGNVVNRVFDSSGPEGKVRGTPQQIIEKYNQLARDAHLSNDRVASENFQQHAEHYLRLLGEAQKELDAKRDQQERENRDRQTDRDRLQRDHDTLEEDDSLQPDIPAEVSDEDEASTLVETPESKPIAKRTPRKPRPKEAAEGEQPNNAAPAEEDKGDTSTLAVTEPAPLRPRRPRKPKADAVQGEAKPQAAQDDDAKPSGVAVE